MQVEHKDNRCFEFSRVSKDVNMNISDSKELELTKNDYLPGGTLTSAFGKISRHIVESAKREDTSGKWNST